MPGHIKPSMWFSGLRTDHPLASRVIGLWPCWEGSGNTRLANLGDGPGEKPAATMVNVTASDWKIKSHGVAIDFGGTNQYAQLDNAGSGTYAFITPFTIACRFRPLAASWTQYDILACCCNSAGGGWRLWSPSQTELEWRIYDTGAASNTLTSTASFSTSDWWTIVANWDGTNMHLWIGSAYEGATASAAPDYDALGRTHRLLLGAMPNANDGSGSQRYAPIEVDFLTILRGASNSDWDMFGCDPYGLIRPRQFWPVAAMGAGAPTTSPWYAYAQQAG